jgi:hypothetical protein
MPAFFYGTPESLRRKMGQFLRKLKKFDLNVTNFEVAVTVGREVIGFFN